ncbi:MAG: methyltransferase domain-containing protein [Pseudomonadota bacterium]
MNAAVQAPPRLFDRRRIARQRARAQDAAQGDASARFLLDHAIKDIVDRLGFVSRQFTHALDLGAQDEALGDALQVSGQVERVTRLGPAGTGASWVRGDEEVLPFAPASFDLVVSALTLHTVNDLPGTLVQVRRALKPDGLFLALLPGAGTLAELRDSLAAAEAELRGGAAMRVAPFVEVRDAGALLQRAGFALPVADLDPLRVRYDTPFGLLRDLQAMGATNPLIEREPLRRSVLARAAEIYAEGADPDGRIPASFNLVSLSGWAPHESQQKPLRPGSAKTRLADALGAEERPLKN